MSKEQNNQDKLKEDFEDKSQRFIQIERVWNWNDKPSGYMINFQYIFKTKRDVIKMSEIIEKGLKSKK